MNFSSPEKPKPEVWSRSPTQAQKMSPDPPLYWSRFLLISFLGQI
jgi:hypothetical protein